MKLCIYLLFVTTLLAGCATIDDSIEQAARKGRAEEQRDNAARADADLRRTTE